MKYLVTAIFLDVPSAERAAADLVANGYTADHISLMTREEHRNSLYGGPGYTNITDRNAPRGAVAGGVIGAIAGGLVALASLGIPGGIVVAGPLAALISGAAAGAAGGTLLGALTGAGIPEKEAEAYDAHVREGKILLGVQADARKRARQAERILKANGAITHPHTSQGGGAFAT